MSARAIGIIIDGNRRWAKERGLSPSEGHREGIQRVRECISWVKERGHISDIFFYTLSTENWKRDPFEIEQLLGFIRDFFAEHNASLEKEGVRVRVVGQRERFPKDIRDTFTHAEARTSQCTALTAWFGLSYGGRAEILAALQRAQALGEPIDEQRFQTLLWSAGFPDPDIIIRTGGEKRLSGFLTWQSVYSELFFVDSYWPAFTREEFFSILDAFDARERRMGK